MVEIEHLKNYFNAVNRILNGQYVNNLEEIFLGDEAILRFFLKNRSFDLLSYFPELKCFYHIADAENRILMGEAPLQTYIQTFSKIGLAFSRDEARNFLNQGIKLSIKSK